jgi:hypothetical protein
MQIFRFGVNLGGMDGFGGQILPESVVWMDLDDKIRGNISSYRPDSLPNMDVVGLDGVLCGSFLEHG